MNKGNLAIKEELDNIAIEDTIIDITQSEQIENIINEDKNIKKPNIIYTIIKKAVDVMSGIVGTILLLPIILIVWIMRLVLKENDGPLFFEQIRIGKNGKQFRMYKFRTMVMEADEKLFKYLEENPEAKKEYKKYKKLKNDPRITKLGKILRKTSIDEFPQFINVLKGDMSLVGPRPYLSREIKDMKDYYYYIIKEKPGLTGPWQVAGRSNIEFEDRLELDYKYVINKTLKGDFIILIKTISAVFKKEGAI